MPPQQLSSPPLALSHVLRVLNVTILQSEATLKQDEAFADTLLARLKTQRDLLANQKRLRQDLLDSLHRTPDRLEAAIDTLVGACLGTVHAAPSSPPTTSSPASEPHDTPGLNDPDPFEPR